MSATIRHCAIMIVTALCPGPIAAAPETLGGVSIEAPEPKAGCIAQRARSETGILAS